MLLKLFGVIEQFAKRDCLFLGFFHYLLEIIDTIPELGCSLLEVKRNERVLHALKVSDALEVDLVDLFFVVASDLLCLLKCLLPTCDEALVELH